MITANLVRSVIVSEGGKKYLVFASSEKTFGRLIEVLMHLSGISCIEY